MNQKFLDVMKDEGPEFAEMKSRFPWMREVLQVKIDQIEQKI